MLVTVGRYFDPWEAHILRARLAAEGIPAFVTGDQHIIAYWPLSVALGGAALQVPEQCLDQSQELVAAYHAGELETDLAIEYPSAVDRCPSCGSTELVRAVPHRQRVLAIITFVLFWAPVPTSASRVRCGACGYGWRYGA
jgi:hypothetical protein